MTKSLIRISENKSVINRLILIVFAIFLFLFALDLMGNSFQHLSKNTVESIINAASDPFVGLFIGLLITVLIQSSSTSTSMIVAAVASGSLTFQDAVPMIMGANIGTTITSTIVALGYIANREDFKRAISAAVAHDFFNILIVIILFPLELKYQFVSSLADYISSPISIGYANDMDSMAFKFINLAPLTNFYTNLVNAPAINLIISFLLLFASIRIISRSISILLIGESEERLQKYIFNNAGKSFTWGVLITGAVQSSSITTSIIIPFVAKDKISLRKIMPFIMGANIGTTITAFIVVLFKSYAVVSIAIVHLLFNVIGVLIFLPFPWLREIPVKMAEKFGELAAKHRFTVVLYVLLLFFIIPFCLIYLTKGI